MVKHTWIIELENWILTSAFPFVVLFLCLVLVGGLRAGTGIPVELVAGPVGFSGSMEWAGDDARMALVVAELVGAGGIAT